MPSFATFLTYDRLNKASSMTMPVVDSPGATAIGEIASALNAIIRGVAVRGTVTDAIVEVAGSVGPASDTEANRGSKWLIRVNVADENRVAQHEIGTADGTVLASPSADFLDITAGVGLALADAIDAIYQTDLGNPGLVASIQQVNRGIN